MTYLRWTTLIGVLLPLAAAASDEPPPPPPSTADILEPIYMGMSLGLPSSAFSLIPMIDGLTPNFGDRMDYRPASQIELGLHARFLFLGGSISFNLPPLFDIQTREGKSTRQDIRLSTDLGRFRVELSYQNYKGYLIENSSQLSPESRGGAPYYLLPELVNTGGGITLFYVPSADYSMAAGFDQSKRQLVSAGSLLVTGSIRLQELRSPGGLIPSEKQAGFGDEGTLSSASMKSAALGLGYAYTLVFRSLFLATSLSAEVGPQWIRYQVASEDRDFGFLGAHTHGKVSLGWNGQRLLTGVSVTIDGYTEATRSIQILNFNAMAQLFAGLRF